MADQTNAWHGAKDGSWTEGGNWSLGTAPQTDTSNDTLIFLPHARHRPTANLDRSADATNNGLQPALVYIHPGVRYDIGQPGGELKMRDKKVVHRGGGTLDYTSAAVAGGSHDTFDILIDSNAQGLAAVLTATTNSHITRVGVANGRVDIAIGATTIETLHVLQRGNRTDVTVLPGAGKLEKAIVAGGMLLCYVDMDYVVTGGGVVDSRDLAGPTHVHVLGGRFHRTSSPSFIGRVYAMGGITNLIGRGDSVSVNIFYKFPRGRVILD